ncbi:MAG: cytochrome c oxidase subunit 3 [Flavobacteriales bacterium]|nr:cytochrome c oxidase subunit 3 [Flavobacteriales bacterium]
MNIAAEGKEEVQSNAVHPKKFIVWLMIIAIIMLFAGLTSAYIVRMGEGNWYQFELPVQFLYSTITILLSSLTMIWAYRAAKKDEIKQVNMGLLLTFILGLGFCYLQFAGWKAMVSMNLYFSDVLHGDRISASFIYALSGLHLAHIIGGIIFIFILIIKSLQLKVHKKSLLSINMCNTYWHFVGILWVYLYLFFYFAH